MTLIFFGCDRVRTSWFGISSDVERDMPGKFPDAAFGKDDLRPIPPAAQQADSRTWQAPSEVQQNGYVPVARRTRLVAHLKEHLSSVISQSGSCRVELASLPPKGMYGREHPQ